MTRTRKQWSFAFRYVWMFCIFVIFARIATKLFDGEFVDVVSTALSGKNVTNVDEVTTGSRSDWGSADQLPEWCKRILANPQPFRKGCQRDSRDMGCINFPGKTLMFSQFKQDYYMFTRHFSKLKRRGIYLDVATNDPVSISNTFFMDRCLRWKGVCVEANPEYYEKIHRLRSCHIVPTCVGRKDGQHVQFGLRGGAGGILGDSNKNMRKWAKDHVKVPSISQRCTTLQLVLDRSNIRTVDFLSLDVEGHELEVLQGVDWTRTRINVMSIEVTGYVLEGIEKLMDRIGYKRHIPQLDEKTVRTGVMGEDAVFLHPDVVFGSPE